MEARACIRSQSLLFSGDVMRFATPAMEYEVTEDTIQERIRDLDAAQGLGVMIHENDHLYRGKTTTIGWLYKISDRFRVTISDCLMFSALVNADRHGDFFSACWQSNGYVGLTNSEVTSSKQVSRVLCALTSFQRYLESGYNANIYTGQDRESFIQEASDGLQWMKSLIHGDKMQTVKEDLAQSEQVTETFCGLPTVRIVSERMPKSKNYAALAAYKNAASFGFEPVLEFIADLNAKRITGFFPERGTDPWSDTTHRQRNEYILQSGGLPPGSEEEADSLRKHLQIPEYLSLFSGVYTSVHSWCGMWLAPFVESQNQNIQDIEHKYGDFNIFPAEFWASLSYALNPPIINEAQIDLREIKCLDQLDSAVRFLFARNYLDELKVFTRLEPDVEKSRAAFYGTIETLRKASNERHTSMQHFIQSNERSDFSMSIVQQIDKYIGLDDTSALADRDEFELLLSMLASLPNYKFVLDGDRFSASDLGLVCTTQLDAWARTGFDIGKGEIRLGKPFPSEFKRHVEEVVAGKLKHMFGVEEHMVAVCWQD